MSAAPKRRRKTEPSKAMAEMPGLSRLDVLQLEHPGLFAAAFRQVAKSLIVAQDWEGLFLHFCGDSDEPAMTQEAALRVQLIRQQIALSQARRGRASGAAEARAKRAEKRQQEDAALRVRFDGLKRRNPKLSNRDLARICSVSRDRVAKILAGSGS